MKRSLLSFIFLLAIAVPGMKAQDSPQKKDPAGSWKFDAPYAPEGFNSGKIVISNSDNKYTAAISFTGNEYSLPGENFKIQQDSLFFSVYIEGQYVNIRLKQEETLKMSGKAVYNEGAVPLTLAKETDKSN